MSKEIQSQNFKKLFDDINNSMTDKDLERIEDIADEMVIAKLLTKKAHKQIISLLDDRLSYLVEKDLLRR